MEKDWQRKKQAIREVSGTLMHDIAMPLPSSKTGRVIFFPSRNYKTSLVLFWQAK